MTARNGAAKLGTSPCQVRNLVAHTREGWIADKTREREAIRAYHDEGGHSWPETGRHFGPSEGTVKQRAYRARKERAAEREAAAKGATLFDIETRNRGWHDQPRSRHPLSFREWHRTVLNLSAVHT